MSTEPETTEHAEPGTPGTTEAGASRDTDTPPGPRESGGADPAPGRDGTDDEAGGGEAASRAEEAAGHAVGHTGGTGAGDGESGDPESDAPETGDPESDAPETGDPESDAPETGDPETRRASAEGAGPGSLDIAGDGDAQTAGEHAGEHGEQDLGAGDADGGSGDLSEAEAELLAQRLERERIERRKAEKKGPIASGAKLSGKAADLLAAVRAVESGEKPAATVFGGPERAPRRPAPEPVRRPRPAPVPAAPAPAAPAAETVRAVRRVLTEGNAPEALAPQVAAVLGEGAEERLRADPWQLLRVAGLRPEQADGFARALLGAECGPGDERRGRAVTGWLLEQAALAGHTALELPQLTATLARRGVPDPDAAVQSTLAEGEALVFQDALDEPGAPARPDDAAAQEDGAQDERPVRVLIGLERYALAEESLADGLARLVNSVPARAAAEEDWERAAASAQGSAADLIRAVAAHALVLHAGGEASLAEPAALLRAAHGLGLRVWAATPSPAGRARFAALLGGPADAAADPAAPVTTVSGLLAGSEGPGRNADGALDLDLLVVFDAPQLDVEAGALLTESLPDGARLVLAGDPAVLWSVGPGRVFADLLAARICPQIASRRPDPGPLGELVSGIGAGELNQVPAPGKEVVIVPVRDAGEAVHRTVQLVADSVPRAIGVPADETQVITPGHGGAVGTRALNAALKERLNPGPGRFGGFDPGDRVAYSPAPGRTLPGRVVKADADGLHLSCAGEAVVVPKDRVERCVRHGWALTAHQAVGGRWPAVVVVLPGDAAPVLSRPWVYTAFGRAERHLSVVHGVEQALPHAVAEVPAKPRTTRLPALLAPQVPAAG
ncbi:helix-hairpin-helix domain-containing protein [Streptomyces sp. NPDC052020]|uniref:helix-hairpin-helix domain-containing protein n=1 Tax=Streptomyces sp. NPDC052020 TaxID=3155677 RepID=UPI0034312A86